MAMIAAQHLRRGDIHPRWGAVTNVWPRDGYIQTHTFLCFQESYLSSEWGRRALIAIDGSPSTFRNDELVEVTRP